MMLVIDKNKIVGDNNGMVIFRSFCHGDAPSMSAASYNARGTFSSPAMNITSW